MSVSASNSCRWPNWNWSRRYWTGSSWDTRWILGNRKLPASRQVKCIWRRGIIVWIPTPTKRMKCTGREPHHWALPSKLPYPCLESHIFKPWRRKDIGTTKTNVPYTELGHQELIPATLTPPPPPNCSRNRSRLHLRRLRNTSDPLLRRQLIQWRVNDSSTTQEKVRRGCMLKGVCTNATRWCSKILSGWVGYRNEDPKWLGGIPKRGGGYGQWPSHSQKQNLCHEGSHEPK